MTTDDIPPYDGRPNGPRRAPQTPRNGAVEPARSRTAPVRSRQARHPLVVFFSFCLTAALLGVLGVGAVLFWGKSVFEAPGPLAADTNFMVTSGSTLETITESLESRGVIDNPWVFIGAAQITGSAGRLKAGEYAFPAQVSMRQVMDTIVSGRSIQHNITFPEGLTSAQIVERLNQDPVLIGSISEIPPEGTLLPETYLFTRGTTRSEMLQRMTRALEEAKAAAWAAKAEGVPIASPEELVILASVVEKETGVAAERPRVAAVFVNRLRTGMRLQSDPTILYGIYGGSAWTRPRTILRSDMQRPNPYNTYQNDGLPPGPIANPGLASLMAVANPADTDELYFVADGTGGHVFARTLDEHNRNVAKWRAIEQQRQSGADQPAD